MKTVIQMTSRPFRRNMHNQVRQKYSGLLLAFCDPLHKYTTALALFFFFSMSPVLAQNDNWEIGGRSAGMSHASVALKDQWACFNNQAALGFQERPFAGVYFENKFQVREFSLKAGCVSYPFHPGTLALSYRYFGYPKYYESKVGLALGRKFTDKLAVGVQMDYLQTFIADGNWIYHAVAAELSLLAEPAKNLFLGMQVFNPSRAKKNAGFDEQIPVTFRGGLSYYFEENAILSAEMLTDLNYHPLYRAGIEIRAINFLAFRLGFSTTIEQYSLGLGYHQKNLLADIAFSYHQVLGFSPKVSMGWNF